MRRPGQLTIETELSELPVAVSARGKASDEENHFNFDFLVRELAPAPCASGRGSGLAAKRIAGDEGGI